MAKKVFDWKYWAYLRAKSLKKKPLKRTRLQAKPMKKRFYPKKNKIPGLYEFYCEMMEVCAWVCEECGANAWSSSPDYRMAAMAHLLNKEHFRSVAKHPQNIKCLGPQCGCHTKYDKNWESAQKMKIWPEIKKIILTVLIPLLPEKEFKKLPDFLKDEYNNRTKD